MTTPQLTASSLVTAAGCGRRATLDALQAGSSGLRPHDAGGRTLHAGAIAGLDAVALPRQLADYDCRNNRIAELTLATDGFAEQVAAAIARHGRDRVGVFVATSTGGMRETEAYFRELGSAAALPESFPLATVHRLSATTDYLRHRLGLGGPAQSISTACSSSAKVWASAARHMAAGLCDAAVIGGVDSLCRTTLFGFHALELTASGLCRPFAPDRDGLCLGEAGALGLLEAGPAAAGNLALLGYGESTDAHHMSTPHPEALGARLALQRALAAAGLEPGAIDYVNLHGTATPFNDAAEDMAVVAELGTQVPASSTKGWTGHTLGAAGMVEALLCEISVNEGLLPQTLPTTEVDPALGTQVLLEPQRTKVRRVLSNSFGFGGNNCALILGAPS